MTAISDIEKKPFRTNRNSSTSSSIGAPRPAAALLSLELRRDDDLSPFLDFPLRVRGELTRRQGRDIDALILETLLERSGKHLVQIRSELRLNRLRHFGLRADAVPAG